MTNVEMASLYMPESHEGHSTKNETVLSFVV